MAKQRVELRDAIRDQVDMDDEELTNEQLDLYLDDAYEQTIAMEDRWPFFESAWSVTTTDGATSYALPDDIDQLASVIDTTSAPNALQAISHDRGEIVFDPATTGGVPAFWSEWGDQLYLWPTAAENRTISLRGYRKGDWAADFDAVVDADERLHVPIMYYAIALVYASQEDEVLEAQYMSRWNSAIQRAHAKIMAAPARRPLVLSGAGLQRSGITTVLNV